MRPVGFVATVALALAGCSLLFNGNDLKGTNGGGGDMSVGGDGDLGSGGSGGGGGGGSGGSGGGGGTAACTPKSTIKFTLSHPSVAGADPYHVALADIDGDGKPDIVTSNYGEDNFSVLLGDGAGNLTLAPTTPIATCTSPLDFAVADLNGDTKPDLVISCFDGTTEAIDVHVNTSTPGAVSFMAPKAMTLPVTNAPFFPVVGKFAGNTAHPGLALVGNNRIYLFYGPGDGTFPTGGANFMAGMGTNSAAVGDLNGDGIDDIVAYNDDDDDLYMATSVGTNYTTQKLAFNTTDMGSSGGQVYFGGTPILVDFDHDGLKDIVIASGTSQPGDIYMFKNSGTANAPSFPVFAKTIDVGDEPLVVAMADFNCDGALDIVSSSNGCQPAQGCSGGPALWVLPGAGTSFGAMQTTTIDPYCDSFAIADFNGDGYPDIACGGGSGNSKSINLLLSTP
ncbi:MAG TPA: VCBS repeat-containing protein [Polyangia bacterium]|nr:VCBS repeat-containing protein [Polyangia bacterium]